MTEKKQQIRDYLAITVGTILIAFAIKNIFDPVSMVTGGVSGAAIILKELWQVPLWLTNTVLNIPLFLAAFRMMGWQFIGRTLYSTAMLSAVTGTKVHAKVAMTGEITLRGRVLPIGGLKEKTLAARMAHMEKVLVPAGNQPDMAEISREITKGLSIVYVKTMEDAMTEVEEGRADYAVLPIENSSAGAVSDNYDLLVKHNVYIAAETELPINHALLGREDADIKDIRTVYSHPQALMQTSQYLNAHRDWKQISTVNTAVAAKKVAEENDRSQAAVASEIAGELYGLKVLERSINHNKNNVTRFIILSKDPVYRKGANKVSICFEGVHRSGSLYNMLGNLIYNDINMLMIESRPIPGRSWEYRFFVDVEGSLSDAKIRNALKGISEEAVSLRILGNY